MGEIGQDRKVSGAHAVGTDAHDLGPALLPALQQACGNRLADVRWFRTDWQTGGAATAFARFTCDDGVTRDVVVKVPVGPKEHRFLAKLGAIDAPTPRIAAGGVELNGYDFAWVIMERFPGDPLSGRLHADVFEHLAVVAARFHAAAACAFDLEKPGPGLDWERLILRGLEYLRANDDWVPRATEWIDALKTTQKLLPKLLAIWNGRRINAWCHGDLHPGNCMERRAGSTWGSPAFVLLDFAEVHPGHWVEDAVYMERIFWARPQFLGGIKPVSLMAKARRELGLDVSDDYGLIANARRALMAATTPAFMEREGHPAHLAATLEVLTRVLPQVVH